MVLVQLGGLMLGHELLHQRGRISRFWPFVVLIQNGYLVYIWEHPFHHMYAGTSLDLASTERHVSIYKYLLGRYPIHIRSGLRHFPSACVATIMVFMTYAVAITCIFSMPTSFMFLGITMLHWLLVDSITYLNHYGVVVKGKHPGKNKDKKSIVAWDAHMWPFLSPFVYGIEYHADHHSHATRLAGELQDMPNGLKYPVTLEVALILALVPPLWYRMTDPILNEVLE